VRFAGMGDKRLHASSCKLHEIHRCDKGLPHFGSNNFMTETTTNITTEEKVYNLTKDLEDMKQRKKAFCKAYNEEIKRIQAEIKDLIVPEEKVELP
jgi:hypothetical protein